MDNGQIVEIWKDVPDYEGIYQVSNFGRLKKLYREWMTGAGNRQKRHSDEKIVPSHFSGQKNKGGYNHHWFIKNGIAKDIKIARLVGLLFVQNPENKPFINHIDGNKRNDHYLNLEWTTHAENDQHAYDIGLRVGMRGSRNGASKLSESDVLGIRKLYNSGLKNKDLCKLYNISPSRITMIIKRKHWSHI